MTRRTAYLLRNGQMTGVDFLKSKDGNLKAYKGEDDILDFTLDLSRWLQSGDTISSASTVTDGVTLDSESNTTTAATLTVSGSPQEGSTTKTTFVTANGLQQDVTIAFAEHAL